MADPTGSLLRELGARVALGQDVVAALRSLQANLPDLDALATVFSIRRRTGAASAPMLDELARLIRERAEARAEVASAVSGMRLSSRLIAGLPLVFMLLGPRRALPGDLFEGIVTAVGVALGSIGFVWMGRITPQPPLQLPVAGRLAGLVAAALRAGAPLPLALDEAIVVAGPGSRMTRQLVRLGAPWRVALRRDPRLEPVAGILETARVTGTPVADALMHYVESARRHQCNTLDAALKKAPIAMALPLVLCVLPSFILLAIVPLSTSLANFP